MDFIKELHEARLTRNDHNIKTLTYTDCCERLYLTALILELLRKYPQGKATVKTYASKTVGKEDYKQFRMYATDLYNFIYFGKTLFFGSKVRINYFFICPKIQKIFSMIIVPVHYYGFLFSYQIKLADL